MRQKRILVCTFVAIASGLTGAYLGSQVNLAAQTAQCDRLSVGSGTQYQQNPLLSGATAVCQTWVTPFALTEGGLTGLWCGMILGAFFAGLATYPKAGVSKK
jgi:hypothetical protein